MESSNRLRSLRETVLKRNINLLKCGTLLKYSFSEHNKGIKIKSRISSMEDNRQASFIRISIQPYRKRVDMCLRYRSEMVLSTKNSSDAVEKN